MHVEKCLGEDAVEDFNISILDRKQRIWQKGNFMEEGGGGSPGYVPISSVRGMPCIIPQAGFEGQRTFWAAMSGTKLRLILRLNDSRTAILTTSDTRLPPSTSAPPRPHLRIANSGPNNQEIKLHLKLLNSPFIRLRFLLLD